MLWLTPPTRKAFIWENIRNFFRVFIFWRIKNFSEVGPKSSISKNIRSFFRVPISWNIRNFLRSYHFLKFLSIRARKLHFLKYKEFFCFRKHIKASFWQNFYNISKVPFPEKDFFLWRCGRDFFYNFWILAGKIVCD